MSLTSLGWYLESFRKIQLRFFEKSSKKCKNCHFLGISLCLEFAKKKFVIKMCLLGPHYPTYKISANSGHFCGRKSNKTLLPHFCRILRQKVRQNGRFVYSVYPCNRPFCHVNSAMHEFGNFLKWHKIFSMAQKIKRERKVLFLIKTYMIPISGFSGFWTHISCVALVAWSTNFVIEKHDS